MLGGSSFCDFFSEQERLNSELLRVFGGPLPATRAARVEIGAISRDEKGLEKLAVRFIAELFKKISLFIWCVAVDDVVGERKLARRC